MKKRVFGLIAVVFLVAFCFSVFSAGASAAVFSNKDIYLKLDGIEGESKDAKHDKWIEVLNYSHGAAQSMQTGSPYAASQSAFEPFVFKHLLDKATPRLQEACMKGSYIKSAQLDYCRSIAGKQEVVYRVKLEGIKIVSAKVEIEELDNGAFRIVETVKMLVTKQTWKVTSIGLDNSIEGNTETTFDQKGNSSGGTSWLGTMFQENPGYSVLMILGGMVVGAAAAGGITVAVMRRRTKPAGTAETEEDED